MESNINKVEDLMEKVEDSSVKAALIQNGSDPGKYVASYNEHNKSSTLN